MIRDINILKSSNTQQSQSPIPMNELIPVACKNCGNDTFSAAMKFGRLSPLHPQNTSSKEQILQAAVWICSQCQTELDTSKEVVH